MATRVIDGIEVVSSSGNVFADLGLPDAEKLKLKSGLMIEITQAVRAWPHTGGSRAAHGTSTTEDDPALLRGDFANLSERKLGNV